MSDVKTEWALDPSENRIYVNRVQDVEPILERAKALHNAGAGWSDDKEYVYAGSMPNVIVEAYCNHTGITFAQFMEDEAHQRRLINDPALSHFRIWKGRF